MRRPLLSAGLRRELVHRWRHAGDRVVFSPGPVSASPRTMYWGCMDLLASERAVAHAGAVRAVAALIEAAGGRLFYQMIEKASASLGMHEYR